MEKTVQFMKFDADKRLAYGEVYVPMVPDSQGDYMTAEGIEKMAHDFLKRGLVKAIDTEHDLKPNGCTVVESFIARKGDPDFVEGAWVVGIHVSDDKQWAMVKSGEFGGFSMYGKGFREPRIIEIELPDDGLLKGDTDAQLGHSHKYSVKFDETGKFMGGETSPGPDGHTHKITRGTVTDDANGHRHRFSFVEKINESAA